MKCGAWRVQCEVWSVKEAVGSEKCEVWNVKCEVWSVKFKFGVRRAQCEVWGLECEGSSEKWEVWSVKCVKCGVWRVKCGVRRVQCAVWGVGGSMEGHGRDRLSLNYRSFMFGKLPPPACPGLCYLVFITYIYIYYIYNYTYYVVAKSRWWTIHTWIYLGIASDCGIIIIHSNVLTMALFLFGLWIWERMFSHQ